MLTEQNPQLDRAKETLKILEAPIPNYMERLAACEELLNVVYKVQKPKGQAEQLATQDFTDLFVNALCETSRIESDSGLAVVINSLLQYVERVENDMREDNMLDDTTISAVRLGLRALQKLAPNAYGAMPDAKH